MSVIALESEPDSPLITFLSYNVLFFNALTLIGVYSISLRCYIIRPVVAYCETCKRKRFLCRPVLPFKIPVFSAQDFVFFILISTQPQGGQIDYTDCLGIMADHSLFSPLALTNRDPWMRTSARKKTKHMDGMIQGVVENTVWASY